MKNDKETEKEAVDVTDMQAYLEKLQQSGAELFVDGEAVLPVEAVRRTVQEECVYMADFVLGESGKIEQVRFDKVDI